MNKKRLMISLVSVVVVLIAGVVGVSYALWDTASQNKNFQVNIGHGLELSIDNVVNESTDSLKNFAPLGTNDVTKGVTSVKIAKFDVVTKTTDDTLSGTVDNVTVNIKYSIKFKDGVEDLNTYFDVYLLNGTDYSNFINGGDLTGMTPLTNDDTATITHSIAGKTQGIVIAWKSKYINNKSEDNTELITKFASKELQVTIDLTAKVVNA